MRHNSSTAVLDVAEPEPARSPQPPAVPALDYRELRLLAECALVNNREVHFYFRGNTLFEGEPTGQTDTDVVVHADDSGRYPRNQVTLKALYDGQPLSLDLEVGRDDAVFWSDAAVQKFVFPYLASCGGDQGATVLQNLQDAWNNYPTKQVSVYALVQQSWLTPSAELDLDLALHVVHVAHPVPQTVPATEPALQMMTLREFRKKYKTVKRAPQGKQAPYRRGSGGGVPQRPSYTTLRAMADWACSLAKEPEYFVFRAGKHGFDTPLPKTLPDDLAPGDIVVPAMTPAVPANRPTLHSVLLRREDSNAPPVDLVSKKADALFWSTGCIEQFLYPYYASKTGFAGILDLAHMIYVWTGKEPVLSPSPRVNAAADTLVAADELEEPTGDEVSGLIHLHTSEWTEVTTEETMEVTQLDRVDLTRQIGVVSVDGSGNHRVERMDGFIVRKWGQR